MPGAERTLRAGGAVYHYGVVNGTRRWYTGDPLNMKVACSADVAALLDEIVELLDERER